MLLALASCGYRFTAPNASLPEDIKSVRVPMFELGRTAGEIAVTQLKASSEVIHRTVRPQLIPRGTCAPRSSTN